MADKSPAAKARAKVKPGSKPAPKSRAKKPAAPAPEPVVAEQPAAPLSPEDELLASMDPRHVEFVEHYLIELNGGKAYKIAFDPNMRDSVARACASRLLTTANVRRLMSVRVKSMFERTEGLQDQMLEQLFAIAFCDPNELSELRREACRYCHGEDHEYQYKPSEWRRIDEQWRKDVKEALEANLDPPEPPHPRGGVGFDPRLAPHEDCPECYGEGIEREVFKDTRHLPAAARALYAGVKRTKDGLEVMVHSQEKAREALHKYLKLYDDRAEVILGVIPTEKLDDLYARAMESARKGREATKGRQGKPVETPREGS